MFLTIYPLHFTCFSDLFQCLFCTSHTTSREISHACLYPQLHTCGYMMVWDLFCSVINFHNIPLPLHRRVLQCCTPVSSHLPWSSSESQWLDSLLSPYRANVTMLQDSLYVTDCYFAPVSHRHTSLQHNRSPKGIGGSLQGSLAITLTRLSLASW